MVKRRGLAAETEARWGLRGRMAEISGGRSRISVTTRFVYARRNNGVDMEIAGRS
jgi:hypothetical protein